MRIQIPEFSMVCMIGTTGSGKSSFCRNHFLPTQVLSSDTYRGYVGDDENSQDLTKPAFEALHFMLAKRLELGRLTVIDATNVQRESRRPLLKIASQWHALKVAIVINAPLDVCIERNRNRPDRQFGDHVVRNQRRDLRESMKHLRAEKWHKIYTLEQSDLESIEIVYEPMTTRKLDEHGPFDIIGDVHGCWNELQSLLRELNWNPETGEGPAGRKLTFLGDLVDRGPNSVAVLKFAMDMVEQGKAIWVPGNHDIKLSRALSGKDVSRNHGLAATMEELAKEPPEFSEKVRDFIHALPSHYVMDSGNLCVAHAGMRAEMMGRGSGVVREFALYGETSGEIDDFGLPVRYDWARDYRGAAMVVYGHTPVPRPEWVNRTIDIDTGCCFGGSLTALRYPERDLVSVPAEQTYYEPARPLIPEEPKEKELDTLLDIEDVTGRRSIDAGPYGMVTIREENAIAALEIMSRFAADPRWLIYLPPTMSPCETSNKDGYLEHPEEAISYFKAQGVQKIVCEEKHMGSRAVAVLCRTAETAAKRFGVNGDERGIITTRTGRRFSDDPATEKALLDRMIRAAETAGLFEELQSDWLLIDAELMPWSAKAAGLLKEQYAPVGAASSESAAFLDSMVKQAVSRGVEGLESLQSLAQERQASSAGFIEAYRRYCWSVEKIEDYKIAPFHLLASEGKTHVDKNHVWHMEKLGRFCDADPAILRRTPYRVIDLDDQEQIDVVCAWWEELVKLGGEGAVFKPIDFNPNVSSKDRTQPAVKCRGPEYLRLIYGPEYLKPENLTRLRKRGLNGKRSLALREFALGIEAMERFVRNEPLRKVHECVFGVLALESEPVDPRL